MKTLSVPPLFGPLKCLTSIQKHVYQVNQVTVMYDVSTNLHYLSIVDGSIDTNHYALTEMGVYDPTQSHYFVLFWGVSCYTNFS